MPTKMYLRKKAKQLCVMGQIVIESHSFLKFLTEPLNPRDPLALSHLPFPEHCIHR